MTKLFTVYEINNGFLLVDDTDVITYCDDPNVVENEITAYLDFMYREDVSDEDLLADITEDEPIF